MVISVPKETMAQECRVAMTPAGVDTLVLHGHKVIVEKGAGEAAGFSDESYIDAGAAMVSADEAWEEGDLIAKVKEPQPSEYKYLKPDKVLFTYLHLAPEPKLTKILQDSGITAIGYETVQRKDKSLPLLTPMSEVAGRLSVQIGSHFLEKNHGGKGVLLEGVPGVAPTSVVVVGAGTVGTGAIRRTVGMGARVTAVDMNVDRLRYLEDIFMGKIQTIYSNRYNLHQAISQADLVIGAVLIPGRRAPKVVTEEMIKSMEPGCVIVDVAVDQGGCIETIDHTTTHADPVYVKHGVLHYAVPNMPGAVPRTSTLALTNATLPYMVKIADKGFKAAVAEDRSLAVGVNIVNGRITHSGVAESLNFTYTPLEEVLEKM